MVRLLAGLSLVLVSLALPATATAGGGGHGGKCVSDTDAPGGRSVAVADNCFMPSTIEIETGQAVTWTPVSGSHTVTFSDGPDSDLLEQDFSVLFRRPGNYVYSCMYHPGMAGSVVVEGDAVSGEALEVLPPDTTDGTRQAGLAGDATLASAVAETSPQQVLIKIDAVTALLLIVFGLSVGAGAVATARMIRG